MPWGLFVTDPFELGPNKGPLAVSQRNETKEFGFEAKESFILWKRTEECEPVR